MSTILVGFAFLFLFGEGIAKPQMCFLDVSITVNAERSSSIPWKLTKLTSAVSEKTYQETTCTGSAGNHSYFC